MYLVFVLLGMWFQCFTNEHLYLHFRQWLSFFCYWNASAQTSDLFYREVALCKLTAASFLKRNLNCSASLIILSAPSLLSSAFLKVILFCITALIYSNTTLRRASLVISFRQHVNNSVNMVYLCNKAIQGLYKTHQNTMTQDKKTYKNIAKTTKQKI